MLSTSDNNNQASQKNQPNQIGTSSLNKPVVVSKRNVTQFVPKQTEVTVDAGMSVMQNTLNNNTIGATSTKGSSPRQVDVDNTMIRGYPRNLSHWIIITGTYSAVFICILLVSRSLPTPNAGKLYIHFTAFWSLLLYFLTDLEVIDYYATDPLDNVVETFIKKENK